MIVVDASIVAPLVLYDEPVMPDEVAERLLAGPLFAPAHWPLEVVNMLHVAARRKRMAPGHRLVAIRYMRDLGVVIATDAIARAWGEIHMLADAHRLTSYDAAYLDLAVRRGAALATLDGALIAAARATSIEVITY